MWQQSGSSRAPIRLGGFPTDDRPRTQARRPQRVGRAARSRRGVASVLAMMFMVIFGSLAAPWPLWPRVTCERLIPG
jgi:hypothetical protein